MKFLAHVVALGGLLVASVASAAPSVESDQQMRDGQINERRGFQVFQEFLSVAFQRAITLPRKNFVVVVTKIFARSDFSRNVPMELVYLGTITLEGEPPKDTYEVHLSTEHLRRSPEEYLRYTAAEIACRMVQRAVKGGPAEQKAVSKCACETVGRTQCVVVHAHVAGMQGHAPEITRSFDEMAVFLQTMENEIKEKYGITKFERP